MSEENNEEPKDDPTPAPEPSPEPQPDPHQVVMTRDELNALLAKEAAKAERRGRRKAEQSMAEPKNQPEPNPPGDFSEALTPVLDRLEALAAKVEQQESEKDFEAAVSGVQLTDAQRKIAKALHGKEEFSAFLEDIKAEHPPAPKGKEPYKSPGGPAPQPGVDRGDPPWKWPREDIEALKQQGKLLEKLKDWRSKQGGSRLFPAKDLARK